MRTKLMFVIGLLFCSLSAGATNCVAQMAPASPDADNGWFSLGVGRAFDNDLSGFISGNIGNDRFIQIALNSNASLFGNRYASSFSVGVGDSYVRRSGRIAVSAGPSLVWSLESRDEPIVYTGGIMANVQVFVTPVKELGLGFDLIGNLNPENSFAGLRLALVVEGNK